MAHGVQRPFGLPVIHEVVAAPGIGWWSHMHRTPAPDGGSHMERHHTSPDWAAADGCSRPAARAGVESRVMRTISTRALTKAARDARRTATEGAPKGRTRKPEW